MFLNIIFRTSVFALCLCRNGKRAKIPSQLKYFRRSSKNSLKQIRIVGKTRLLINANRVIIFSAQRSDYTVIMSAKKGILFREFKIKLNRLSSEGIFHMFFLQYIVFVCIFD